MREQKPQYIREQTMKFRRGRIGRRAFISSMLSAGVTVPTAMGMASQVIAETPQPGGTLRLALAQASSLNNLDPARALDGFSAQAAFLYGNALTEIAPDGALRGDLATGFEDLGNGQSWMFDLRPGVSFHSGKSLTATDVIASFSRLRDLPRPPAVMRLISGMRAEDPARIRIDLYAALPSFARELADPRFIILPEKDGSLDPAAGIGTGPYQLQGFAPLDGLKATRWSNYHHSDRAYFEQCELCAVPDTNTRLGALLNDEADAIDQVEPGMAALLDRAPNISVQTVPGSVAQIVAFAQGTPANFRDAVSLGLDRDAMVESLVLGRGFVGSDKALPTAEFPAGDVPALTISAFGAAGVSATAKAVCDAARQNGIPAELTNGPASATDAVALQMPTGASDLQMSDATGGRTELLVPILAHALNGLSGRLHTPRVIADNANLDGFKAPERWWFAA